MYKNCSVIRGKPSNKDMYKLLTVNYFNPMVLLGKNKNQMDG